MSSISIHYHDRVTVRPLNELGTLHEPDFTVEVVPGYEGDADHGRISEEAPLGRALMGRRCGETVTVRVRDRSLSMLIIAVAKAHDHAMAA